jgi:hypothetical protein
MRYNAKRRGVDYEGSLRVLNLVQCKVWIASLIQKNTILYKHFKEGPAASCPVAVKV